MTARNPDMAFFPTSISAVEAASDSVICEKYPRRSVMISPRLLMLPSALVVCTVTSPKERPDNSMSPVKLVSMVRRDVPACVDLIPAFAIRPIASATSSAVYPKAPATGAAYLNVSPIIDTLVFALLDAAAKISAKCPESAAVSPKAVRASVTISDVVARSSPDAAARLMIPSIPESISDVFHPAIAI